MCVLRLVHGCALSVIPILVALKGNPPTGHHPFRELRAKILGSSLGLQGDVGHILHALRHRREHQKPDFSIDAWPERSRWMWFSPHAYKGYPLRGLGVSTSSLDAASRRPRVHKRPSVFPCGESCRAVVHGSWREY